ncbi:hypothetical protein [Paenibacillus agricola]|uniref:Uncharacterized protein n=1 Tax=Paenibacillus agricola TaxID=2716264 RepID=A0ABX0J483_9BACL|nr:hypothetical protein [Paenibacillus agricola]NHN28824.1 hypothetical protein [Paenibacillus agricola]
MQNGDGLVIFLIMIVLGFWIFLSIRARIRKTVEGEGLPIPDEAPVTEDEVTRLLDDEGYKVISGKQRIPIHISVNDNELLQSRLFIDYFVEREGLYYIVKSARERKPMELTGSSIRDHLLVFHLLYPQTTGILYVDSQQRKVQRILFQIDNEDEG